MSKKIKQRMKVQAPRRRQPGYYCRLAGRNIDTATCVVNQTREPGACFGCGQTGKDETMNLNDIEKLTKEYSDERTRLADRIRFLEDEINTLKRKRLPGIKNCVHIVVEKQENLKAALEESRPLFIKPRTVVFHGVKVGFQKGKGKLEWSDDATVVKLIKKHFPEQAETLIKTTEKPIRGALENLPTADLKRIGITVNDTDDAVVIKSTDSEIDKFVETLLKDDNPEMAEVA